MKQLDRIFIIGHPAAGKAYFAEHLADKIAYQFIDADMGLEHRIGLNIKDILGQEGLKYYAAAQEKIFESLSQQSAIVVGLDCYIPDTAIVKSHLKNAYVIYLKTSLETQLRRCGSRHRPLIAETHFDELLKNLQDERNDFYNEISDYVLPADEGSIDRHIDAVLENIKQNELMLLAEHGLKDSDLIYFKFNTDIPIRISEQQAICLKHLSKGMSAKKIAREMKISYRTVEVYIAQLKEKLACDSSKDLISLYLSRH